MTTSRHAAINAQLRAAEKNLQEAIDLHAAASLKLVDTPASKLVQGELDSLEREIAGHERAITRFHAALGEDARRNSAAAIAADRAASKESELETNKLALQRVKLAGEIDNTLTVLREQLSQLEAMNIRINKGMCDAVRPFEGTRRIDTEPWTRCWPDFLDEVRARITGRWFNERSIKSHAQQGADRLATKMAYIVPRDVQ